MQFPSSVVKHMQNVKQVRTDGQSRKIYVLLVLKIYEIVAQRHSCGAFAHFCLVVAKTVETRRKFYFFMKRVTHFSSGVPISP
jgi:hypothetical protein